HLPVRPFTLALLLIRRPPTPTLFPYTTLFRSSKRVPLAHKLPWSRPPCRQGRQSGRLRSLMTSPRRSLDRQQQRRSTAVDAQQRSEEHTSELQSRENLVCRLLLEKKK